MATAMNMDLRFLYIVPLKQGLKLSRSFPIRLCMKVFIHSSIKTRIETDQIMRASETALQFLYIVPLKQGLKLEVQGCQFHPSYGFYT